MKHRLMDWIGMAILILEVLTLPIRHIIGCYKPLNELIVSKT